MPSRPPVASLPVLAVLLAGMLAGACSSAPVSQVRTTAVPSTDPVPTGPDAPASSPPAATEAPVQTAPPGPTATPGIPPKPAKVTFKEIGRTELGGGETRVSSRLAWTSPEGVATAFLVYGVTDCLRYSKKNDGKPCVVKGMRIPKDTLKLVATVPGAARTVDISWKEGEIGPGPYSAVLIRATNDAGDSIFTIAWSADVCWKCTY